MAIPRIQQSNSRQAEALRQDLTVGLHTVTEINQSIRYADTKAGALAAVQALSVTVLLNRSAAGTASLAPTLFFTLGLLLVLLSATLLVAGQVPRLSRKTAAGCRTAFPALAAMATPEVLIAPSLTTQHDQVWRQASDLAVIAMTKYRWLHRATVATFLTLAAVLLWLGVTTWLALG